jgi:hypothetical protein
MLQWVVRVITIEFWKTKDVVENWDVMLIRKIRDSTDSLFIEAFAAACFLQRWFVLWVDYRASDAVSIAQIINGQFELEDKHV